MKEIPGYSFLIIIFMVSWMMTSTGFAAQFEVQIPGKLNISRNIKKVFISPDMMNDTNDKLKIKNEVVVSLKRRLNALERFEAIIGPPRGYDPERETVAVINGDIISGGDIDYGQLTEKASCKGGLSGVAGTISAKTASEQGITFSRRRIPCAQLDLKSQLIDSGISTGLSMLGISQMTPRDDVIRVYKYKNVSISAQVNLSFTQLGKERETLAISADAASFGRHIIYPNSFHNVRESGDNAAIIWLWFQFVPIAPVVIKEIGIVTASNPGSPSGKWYNRVVPGTKDIPRKERQQVITQLVNKVLTQFIRTISPYKSTITAEIASGGNSKAQELIEEGKYLKARKILEGSNNHNDLYNLGLTMEAKASTTEDYEDAMHYYSQALEKSPGTKIYAQGIGRMEFRLRTIKK